MVNVSAPVAASRNPPRRRRATQARQSGRTRGRQQGLPRRRCPEPLLFPPAADPVLARRTCARPPRPRAPSPGRGPRRRAASGGILRCQGGSRGLYAGHCKGRWPVRDHRELRRPRRNTHAGGRRSDPRRRDREAGPVAICDPPVGRAGRPCRHDPVSVLGRGELDHRTDLSGEWGVFLCLLGPNVGGRL